MPAAKGASDAPRGKKNGGRFPCRRALVSLETVERQRPIQPPSTVRIVPLT